MADEVHSPSGAHSTCQSPSPVSESLPQTDGSSGNDSSRTVVNVDAVLVVVAIITVAALLFGARRKRALSSVNIRWSNLRIHHEQHQNQEITLTALATPFW